MASIDYYAILELSHSAEEDDIRAAYRRLAKLRHPDKNPDCPNATVHFQHLHEAYETLHDPLKRQKYDARNGRRDEREGTRAQRTSPRTGQRPETAEMRELDRHRKELTAKLARLQLQKHSIEDYLSTTSVELNRKRDVLRRLRDEESRRKSDEASKRYWWGFLWRTTPAQDEERNRDATSRRTGMLVVERQLNIIETKVKEKNKTLEDIEREIRQTRWHQALADKDYQFASVAEAKRKQEQERQRSAEIERERQRRHQTAQQTTTHRRRDEAAGAAETAKTRRRREKDGEEAADRQKDDEFLRNARRKRTPEPWKRANPSQPKHDGQTYKAKGARKAEKDQVKSGSGQSTSCCHRAWWDRVPGPGICQRCGRRTPRFCFECPGCHTEACADCRDILKRQ